MFKQAWRRDVHHIGPMAILMPHQDCQINIMEVQGIQLTRTIEVTRSNPDNYCLSFVGIQVCRRDFHHRCECSFSDSRGSKNWPLMSQVVRLARFETGFVQKKWAESRIAEVVCKGLILKHYAMGKTLGLDKMVLDARWSAYWGGPEPRLYCMCIVSDK